MEAHGHTVAHYVRTAVILRVSTCTPPPPHAFLFQPPSHRNMCKENTLSGAGRGVKIQPAATMVSGAALTTAYPACGHGTELSID